MSPMYQPLPRSSNSALSEATIRARGTHTSRNNMLYRMPPLPLSGGLYSATFATAQAPMPPRFPGGLTPPSQPVSSFRGAPTDEVPGLLGRLSRELSHGGLDPAISATQIPAFASLLVQALADTSWPNGQQTSIGFSGYLKIISSGGKSLPYRLLRGPIDRAVRAWTSENADKKIDPAPFAEDATREALILHLREWKWAALFSDDAGQCKQLLKTAAPMLAKLNDGDDLNHARVKDGRVALTGHRFNLLLCEQPGIDGVGRQLLTGSNAGVGLVNRMFVAEASVSGIPAALHDVTFSNEARDAYDKRVKTLVDQSIAQVISGGDRPVLRLSRDAAKFLIASGNELRDRYRRHPRAQALSSYIVRHAERVLRLAGVVHVFEYGATGEIQLDVLKAADVLGRWSVEQFECMTDVSVTVSQFELDVQRLAHDLHRSCVARGLWTHELAEIRRQSFNAGLTKTRFDRALAELCGRGGASIVLRGRKDILFVHQTFFWPY